MYYQCKSLISLDLRNFNTSSVTNMNLMLFECNSLISLIIDDFNVSSVKTNYDKIFYNCYSLVSLNLSNFNTLIKSSFGMFGYLKSNLTYCIDDKKSYEFIEQLQNYRKNCSDICITYNSKKYVIEENLCIDKCPIDKKYKYEYNNICYENNPYDNDNSITLIINETIGKEIINSNYFNDISKIIVNGKESNLTNYRNYVSNSK